MSAETLDPVLAVVRWVLPVAALIASISVAVRSERRWTARERSRQ